MNSILIPLFLALGAALAVLAAVFRPGGRAWWFWAGAALALVLTSRLAPQGWAATTLAVLAEVAAVALVGQAGTREARAAARLMLGAVAGGLLLTQAGELLLAAQMQAGGALADTTTTRIAVTLLISGFALKLGLVPVFFWLPAVARASSALTTALIVVVIDVNVFSELLALHAHVPAVFNDFRPVWLGLAVVTLLGGALLALAQDHLKPMLAFSTIDDMGYLLLGLTLGSFDSLTGAWLGLLSHALAKCVLFGAVAAAEWHLGQPVTLHTRGLASRLPVASAAFMLGALAFLAVPPTLGFAGRWRLYAAGAELGGAPLLLCLLAASALGLLCYVRAIHSTWLGTPHDGPAGRPLPHAAAAVMLALAIAPVVLGLMPGLLHLPAPVAAHASLEGLAP